MSIAEVYHWALWAVGRGPWAWPADGGKPLRLVEQHVARRYASLTHLEPEAVAAGLARVGGTLLLLDAREPEEFAVSRLPGAIHIPPRITAADFRADYGSRAAGRDIVVYCSVGIRSARLAFALRDVIDACGARSCANMSGGIFRWHNESRPLEAVEGAPRVIHPYSAYWSRFIAGGG
jgi:rhodanese-related sulfurtransferase